MHVGPYSRGSACFGKNGEIDKQLSNYLQVAFNRVIDTDASGCFCNT